MSPEIEFLSITDIANLTATLHAELMTAKSSNDSQTIHASTIDAVAGLLRCVRSIAAELLKIEVEGVDAGSF